jgi:UDP-glucose 4-epimerase
MSGVLVTGATTPFGAALVELLAAQGDDVAALGAELDPGTLSRWPAHRVSYFRCDVTRPRELARVLYGPVRELGVTAIVHTALHRSATDTGRHVRALNVESTRELLSLAERHPTIRRFVYRSYSDVYRVSRFGATLLSEDDPIDLSGEAPQRVRDRVEADVMVCTRMGLSPLSIQVLRCAEILAPDVGSQLYDYLRSFVCLRPLGFDPMLNLLTIEDAARALCLALHSDAQGVFNIAGADTLPLSLAIRKWGRKCLAVPGPLLAPLYRLRAGTLDMEFRYDMNYRRFHFSAVLDGRRAKAVLGYAPIEPIVWPLGEEPAVETETRIARALRKRAQPSNGAAQNPESPAAR